MPYDLEYMRNLYTNFNNRNAGAVLSEMQPDVDWPNGWEGGYVSGQEEVREYWKRQWAEVDPKVEPLHTEELPDGRIAVTVHQLVKDHHGNLLMDVQLTHTYTFKNGLITRMDIGKEA